MSEALFPLDETKLHALHRVNEWTMSWGLTGRYHDTLRRSGTSDIRLAVEGIKSGELTKSEKELAEEVATRGRKLIAAYRAELPVVFKKVLNQETDTEEVHITKINPRIGTEPDGAALPVCIRLTGRPEWYPTHNFQEGDVGNAHAMWTYQLAFGIEL